MPSDWSTMAFNGAYVQQYDSACSASSHPQHRPKSSLSFLLYALTQQEFFGDDTLHILVGKLLNCQNEQVSDKDTKLDVLAILANLVSFCTL